MIDINWKRTLRFSGNIRISGAGESLGSHYSVISVPRGFQLDENGLERRISWRWFSWYAMRGPLFAAIFSVPFAFVYFIYANSSNKSWPSPALAIMFVLALPGAATIYVWLACIFNHTTIVMDPTRISVQHGPLPLRRSRNVERADIDGIISERLINDSDSSDGTIFQPRVIYRVRLLLKSGKTRKLINGLIASEHAMFIEQEIRRTLRM